MLRFSGDNMIVPFFPDHDYIFVPSQTNRIVYYDRKPEILQNFSYLSELHQTTEQEEDKSSPIFGNNERSKENSNSLFFPKGIISFNKFNLLTDETVEDSALTDIENESFLTEDKVNVKKDNKIKSEMKSKKIKEEKKSSPKIENYHTKMETILLKRCHGCHVCHFPLPRFCRWWERRNLAKKIHLKERVNPNQKDIPLIHKCISRLEESADEKTHIKNEIIVNNFFNRSKDSSNPKYFPDMLNPNKLKGGCCSRKVAIKSENRKLDSVLSFFGGMAPLWYGLDSHKLCNHKQQPNCFYCLLRSLSLRSMNPKVKTAISAVEVLPFLLDRGLENLDIHEIVESILKFLSNSEAKVSNMFKTISKNCELCHEDIQLQDTETLNIHVVDSISGLQESLNKHLQQRIDDHFALKHKNEPVYGKGCNTLTKITSNQSLLFVVLDREMMIDLDDSLIVGGKWFTCISAIKVDSKIEGKPKFSNVFKENTKWIMFDENYRKQEASSNDKFLFCLFKSDESITEKQEVKETLMYSRSVLHDYFRGKTAARKESGRKRRAEYVKENPELVREQQKTFKDNHPESGSKRQETFKDNHPESERIRKLKSRFNKKVLEINTDTGMELICALCLERKSISQCSAANTLIEEKYKQYVTENRLTLSIDGKYHICISCKTQVNRNNVPKRCQKEIFGFLNFPDVLKDLLEEICIPKSIEAKEDPEKKYLNLNKCEDYLLKLVIPFIRVAHLPRGRYFKVIGDLILISADLMQTMDKILPLQQSLIPVSFKRSLQYKGHYIEEYVDKEKVLAYFNWFKENNHLFKDFTFDTCLVDDFQEKAINKSKHIDEEKDDNSEVPKNESESVPKNHSSHLRNKYVEDIESETVANNLADLIVHFEKDENPKTKEFYDEEEIFYSDDEEDELVDEEDEKEMIDENQQEINMIQEIKQKSKTKMENLSNLPNKCEHTIDKVIGMICGLINDAEKVSSKNEKVIDMKKEIIIELSNEIRKCINMKREKPALECEHLETEFSTSLKDVLDRASNQSTIRNHVTETARKIEKRAKKIFVAPGEKGKFVNWKQNIFIEEMAFPNLFPYGIGGYLSSNILSGSDIGFANYCRNRLLSADPKFRNDHNYLFFLLLVKELIEMKRSKATYLRKAAKHPNLTRQVINELKKENLNRNNNVFNVYKNLRGSAPYYQKAKQNLFAMIRQHGSPTLFQTISCAEFEWDHLCKQIYETVYNETIDLEVISSKDNKWKNKLVSENVVQSTIHFQKRTQKLISIMQSNEFYDVTSRDGTKTHYGVKDYFYRVEFQQRGAPHIHCLLWLESKDETDKPPTLWADEEESSLSKEDLGKEIARFASSIISGSVEDAHCLNHCEFTQNCEDCQHTKKNVEKYQCHHHTFTCKKKNKIIRINANEGHGKNDGKVENEELILPACRFRLPFYPIDEAEFIFPFEEDTTEEVTKKAMKDFNRVRKFILRMTSDAHLEDCPKWKKFKSMTFKQFLIESGMLKEENKENEEEIQKARSRYLTALRADVRGAGMLILKRNPCDVFTNNYNNKLMNYHEANQDIQYVSDMFACAQYVTNYLTKSETNMSALLKNINEEGSKKGMHTTQIIDQLSKALDKNREVSIQEAVYRILGLPMCKFSKVVQFISTVHPHRRDGLLKAFSEDEEDDQIFHDSMFTYYESRPKYKFDEEKDEDYWDTLSLSEFVAQFDHVYGKPSREEIERKKLIKLENNKGFIKERNNPKTLRYYLNHDNDEDFCRALCILFLPFRNEMQDIHLKCVKTLVDENRIFIDEKRLKFEKHLTMVEFLEKVQDEKEQESLEENEDEEANENEERWIEEETTDEMDIREFEKMARREDKLLLSHFKDEIDMRLNMTEFRDLISGLNFQQRRIFDDIVERLCDVRADKQPFYVYIGGNAGTGKSHVIQALMEATKYLGRYSGSELEKPSVLVMAPTGNAAFIIHGKTIESALGMQPQKGQGYMKMSASRESTLNFTYENLLSGFIDEISMVGANKFARINFRLQDIKGSKDFMGGIPLITTGDFGQLPPVGDQMIWKPGNLDGRPMISTNFWDEHFSIYFLTEKMRTKDENFAEICDKIRKGEIDDEVENFLKSRVIETEIPSETNNDNFKDGKLSIIVPTNKKREQINNEKLLKLLPNEKQYEANATDRATNFKKHPKSSKGKDEGQLSSNLALRRNAPVVITCNHSEAKYRDDGINNGARGYIDSIQPSKENPEEPEVVWVVFNDKSIGVKLRESKKHLTKEHKPYNKLAVPIERQKRQFSPNSGNITYQRSQFPLTLAYALTSHKCQGQTLEEVIIDFRNCKVFPSSFYVALTRVKEGNKVYLRNYQKDYINVNEDVEKKIKAMQMFKKYVTHKTYLDQQIYVQKNEEIKIGYLNINGLTHAHHGEYLNEDKNLSNLDILALSETKLKKETNEEIYSLLSNWVVLHRQDSEDSEIHMGMLILISKKSNLSEDQISIKEMKIWSKYVGEKLLNHMQMINIKIKKCLLKVSFIYVRKTPDNEDINRLRKYVYGSEVVLGDFNLNLNVQSEKRLMDKLCSDGKMNHMNDVTTDKLNQLDYVLLDEKIVKDAFSTAYKNFMGDHKSITVRIPYIGNEFSEEFKLKHFFDADHHLKPKKKKKEKEATKAAHDIQGATKDLSSLDSPNWVKDEIIDLYFELIMKTEKEFFAFPLHFFTLLKKEGYESVKTWYEEKNLFSYKKLFFPIYDNNHYYLMVYENAHQKIESYDPYDFISYSIKLQTLKMKENQSYHEASLSYLVNNYLKPKFEAVYEGMLLQFKSVVHTPPEIPKQANDSDCGVFLLQFAKHIVLKKKLDFKSEHVESFRQEMKIELSLKKLIPIKYVEKVKMKSNSKASKKQTKTTKFPQRRFDNKLLEDCWMNSTLQMILTGLDHLEECAEHGSTLWSTLIYLKNQDKQKALNPLPVKKLLISKENERMHSEIGTQQMLLSSAPNIVSSQRLQIGQQDAKDFFICLKQNQMHWHDVFNTFKVKMKSITECSRCGQRSIQKESDDFMFLEFTCPNSGEKMNNYLTEKMEHPEIRTEWRDEEGCGQRGEALHYFKVVNLDECEFFIIVLKRLVDYGNGPIILRNRVILGEEVQISDLQNKRAKFKPIAVIFHIGDVQDKEAYGHFKADVKNVDGNWYRTSDDMMPQKIKEKEVSDQGYIFLYKKIHEEN